MRLLYNSLELIEDDGDPEATIIFLGDYTDRGPDSWGILNLLIQGRDTGRNWIFLKGNHDRMFEWVLQTPSRGDRYLFFDLNWLHDQLGGKNNLQSYGLEFTIRHRLSTLNPDALAVMPKP